ncbi:hypothetical protein [Bordetella sp. N]|uniref:hypothetical protein n=1 Tax=Bordetella sp. N TaxID=1746199 RepID=UPI00070C12E3|nr:hypothetical protein [Bordetella sp. N]ALM86092.1 hypothetical protein ASB57_26865 [Bordetella sp. N]
MFNNTLSRAALAFVFVGIISGCSSGPKEPSRHSSIQCAISKSSCMYDGPYDDGESDYAEEEAAKLNRQQQGKLRGQ